MLKHSEVKKDKRPSLAEGSIMDNWARLVGLGTEEIVVGGPPPKTKKTGSGGKIIYKYPQARKFFHDMSTLHELLVASLESPDLGLVKIRG